MCIILKTDWKNNNFWRKKNHNFQDICVKEVNGLWFSSLMHYSLWYKVRHANVDINNMPMQWNLHVKKYMY